MAKYYIAGPMRGYPEFNFPAFFKLAAILRAAGHAVFNPAEHETQRGLDVTGLKGDLSELDKLGFCIRDALAADTQFICLEATDIYMLPGWSNSKGATAERALALALDLKIHGAPA